MSSISEDLRRGLGANGALIARVQQLDNGHWLPLVQVGSRLYAAEALTFRNPGVAENEAHRAVEFLEEQLAIAMAGLGIKFIREQS